MVQSKNKKKESVLGIITPHTSTGFECNNLRGYLDMINCRLHKIHLDCQMKN